MYRFLGYVIKLQDMVPSKVLLRMFALASKVVEFVCLFVQVKLDTLLCIELTVKETNSFN